MRFKPLYPTAKLYMGLKFYCPACSEEMIMHAAGAYKCCCGRSWDVTLAHDNRAGRTVLLDVRLVDRE